MKRLLKAILMGAVFLIAGTLIGALVGFIIVFLGSCFSSVFGAKECFAQEYDSAKLFGYVIINREVDAGFMQLLYFSIIGAVLGFIIGFVRELVTAKKREERRKQEKELEKRKKMEESDANRTEVLDAISEFMNSSEISSLSSVNSLIYQSGEYENSEAQTRKMLSDCKYELSRVEEININTENINGGERI